MITPNLSSEVLTGSCGKDKGRGHLAIDHRGEYTNDSDEETLPGAGDDCFNCIDDACDGLLDLEDPDCTCWDNDGDGFADQACGGTDCDDANPDINVAKTEGFQGDPVCSDGLDNDCNGQIDSADPVC